MDADNLKPCPLKDLLFDRSPSTQEEFVAELGDASAGSLWLYLTEGRLFSTPVAFLKNNDGVVYDSYTGSLILFEGLNCIKNVPGSELRAVSPQNKEEYLRHMISSGGDRAVLESYMDTSGPLILFEINTDISVIGEESLFNFLRLVDQYLDLPNIDDYDPVYYLLFLEEIYSNELLSPFIVPPERDLDLFVIDQLPRFAALNEDIHGSIPFSRSILGSDIVNGDHIARSWILSNFTNSGERIDLTVDEQSNKLLNYTSSLPFGVATKFSTDVANGIRFEDFTYLYEDKTILYNTQVDLDLTPRSILDIDERMDLFALAYDNFEWLYTKLFLWSYLHGVCYIKRTDMDWFYYQLSLRGLILIEEGEQVVYTEQPDLPDEFTRMFGATNTLSTTVQLGAKEVEPNPYSHEELFSDEDSF